MSDLTQAQVSARADSSGTEPPIYNSDMTWQTVGSRGLRQYGGWVREEFLPQLVGRQACRTYRMMMDNCPPVGAIIFAITQTMRECIWRVEPAADTPDARYYAEFVESCMDDMKTTWPDFVCESLSMLPFGFAPHEIVYKRRLGRTPGKRGGKDLPKSKYDDGLIGLRNLPLRGQETVIKWFFDDEGNTTGMTQQPYFGGLIDIPMKKLLLFRPRNHKGNPEGTSILRTAYRPWYFLNRLEEQEAIMLERFSGFPVITVPSDLLKLAATGDTAAVASLDEYKRIVTNIRVDEQMGAVLPSDTYKNEDGTRSNVAMYSLKFEAPAGGKGGISANDSIERYKLDIMTSVLADFLMLGHGQSSRGSQTLGEAKIDLFFKATESWLECNAEVLNSYLLPRLWDLNGFDYDLMPKFMVDMPQRVDLDGLSNFILRMTQAGMPIFPDPEAEAYLRDAAGLPEVSEEALMQDMASGEPEATENVKKALAGMMARRMVRKGFVSGFGSSRKRA